MNTQNTQNTTLKPVVPNQGNLQQVVSKSVVKEEREYPVTVSEKVYIRRKERPEEKYRYDQKVDVEDVLADHLKFIGSSFGKGKDVLRGLNMDEEAKLLPILIGSGVSAPNWEEIKKEYWCNIKKLVPSGIGLELEIGMTYPNKDIHDRVIKFVVNNSHDTVKCEQFKLLNGTPINVEDYVLYRYCLVYGRVANDIADINKSNKINFYIYSKVKEVNEQAKEVGIRRKAYDAYLRNMTKTDLRYNILLLFDLNPDRLTDAEQDIEFERLARTQPNAFMAQINGTNLEMKGLIERAILKQKLYRLPNTDAIYYGDQLLGETLEKAAAYLADTKQSKLVVSLNSELNLIA